MISIFQRKMKIRFVRLSLILIIILPQSSFFSVVANGNNNGTSQNTPCTMNLDFISFLQINFVCQGLAIQAIPISNCNIACFAQHSEVTNIHFL